MERTGDSESLIAANCRAARTDVLRYQYREAHRLTRTDHVATPQFVTQPAPSGLCVTGVVVISPHP